MTGNEVRRKFLDYFSKVQHQIVRSSSLVPHDDPTLLFTNAGMVQFKRTFLGEEQRGYLRAATAQKCVRAGGKHNDLENVGYTARHHTFFEMLGNFSFGDYFKEQALAFAWELLTVGYGLPADRLWVSVFREDDEAAELWQRRIGVPAERILRLDEKDNFWAMGDTGPCGPCSEIHIDRGAAHGCGRPDCSVACDCDRFLEIWNLVFMQFNRDETGKMSPLPKPSIDTGAGLERLTSVLQAVPTNFDTDLLLPIIRRAEALSGIALGAGRASDVAMKVIADHSRAAAFLIGDGVLPSNEGRGYVLRRIMRRAIRYGRNIGLTRPFLHETARTVFEIMAPAYPELRQAAPFITSVIENEELRFSETLDNGLRLLGETLAELEAKGQRQVPGAVIFKLYDTYGFPVDIVRDVVRDKGLTLDMQGFEGAMQGQRERSRQVTRFTPIGDAFRELSAHGVRPEFVGYDRLECDAQVLLVVQGERAVDAAHADGAVQVVTDRSPFYAESGGQVGDRGTLDGAGLVVEIGETVKDPTGIVIHRGRIASGTLRPGDRVRLRVDGEARGRTARNHTATHILHAVLRSVLGEHVRQAGSLVTPDRLRFDFTHFAALEAQILQRIEQEVNARIREDIPSAVAEMDAEAALKSGAMALFEEKYGDRVRVVSLGGFSRELCGGTHSRSSGEIGLFKILAESGVAAGVRRIEALTGAAALEHVQAGERLLQQTARLLRERPEGLPQRVERLLAEIKALEKRIAAHTAQQAAAAVDQAGGEVASVAGVRLVARRVEADSPAALRDLADRYRDRIGSGVVVLGSVAGGKALLIAAVTRDLAERLHAGEIIRQVVAAVGGKGGGRPDLAQAGGPRPEGLDAALAMAAVIVEASARR
jgi:alanyl-tRNA synthetase